MGNLFCCSKSQHLEELKGKRQIHEIEDLKQPAVVDIEAEAEENVQDESNKVSPCSVNGELEERRSINNEGLSERNKDSRNVYDDGEAIENHLPSVPIIPPFVPEHPTTTSSIAEKEDPYQTARPDECHSKELNYYESQQNIYDKDDNCKIDDNYTFAESAFDDNEFRCVKSVINSTSDVTEGTSILRDDDDGIHECFTNETRRFQGKNDMIESHPPGDVLNTVIKGTQIINIYDNVVIPLDENIADVQEKCTDKPDFRHCPEIPVEVINVNEELMNELINNETTGHTHDVNDERSAIRIRREDSIRPSYLPKRPSPLVITDIPSMAHTDPNPTEQEEDARSKNEKPSKEETRQLNKERLEELSRDQIKPKLKLIEDLIDEEDQPRPTSKERATNEKYRRGSLTVLKLERKIAYKKMVKEKAIRALTTYEDDQRVVSPACHIKPTTLNQTKQTPTYESAEGRRFTKKETSYRQEDWISNEDSEQQYNPQPASDYERKESNELVENKECSPSPTFMFEKLKQKRLATERNLLKVSASDSRSPVSVEGRYSFLPMDQRSDSSESSESTDSSRSEDSTRRYSFDTRDDGLVCSSGRTSSSASVESLPFIQVTHSSFNIQPWTTLHQVDESRSLCEWSERDTSFPACPPTPLYHWAKLPVIGEKRYGKTNHSGSITNDLPPEFKGNVSRPSFSFSNHLTDTALQHTLQEATHRVREVGIDDLQRIENSNSATSSRTIPPTLSRLTPLPAIKLKKDTTDANENINESRHKPRTDFDKI